MLERERSSADEGFRFCAATGRLGSGYMLVGCGRLQPPVGAPGVTPLRRRLNVGDDVKEVALETGRALSRPAEIRVGENIGATDTHVFS